MNEQKKKTIEIVQGIIYRCAELFKNSSQEERLEYSRYVFEGKDRQIKILLLFNYRLWDDANIEKLLAAGDKGLVEAYLKWCFHERFRKYFPDRGNFNYFKKLVLENYPDFLPLLLSKSDEREQKEIRQIRKIINAEDEIAMIKKERAQPNENSSYNETLEKYLYDNKVESQTLRFLHEPGYEHYLEYYLRFHRVKWQDKVCGFLHRMVTKCYPEWSLSVGAI